MTMTITTADLIALMTHGALEAKDYPTAPAVAGTPTRLDTKMRATVLRLINKYGKTVIFSMYPNEVYSPETGGNIQGSAASYSKKIIPPFEYEIKYIDGDLIKAGDMLSGVAASGLEFTPVKGMTVIIDNKIWAIVKTCPVYSGEQICLYLFQLRK